MAAQPSITFTIRPAAASDCDALHRWNQQPGTREHSRSTDVPSLDEHRAWYALRLDSPRCRMYVAALGERGDSAPIGVVRFEATVYVEISAVVDADYRGRGIGSALIREACKALWRDEPWCSEVYATIHHRNDASRLAFERAGFLLCDLDSQTDFPWLLYRLTRPAR